MISAYHETGATVLAARRVPEDQVGRYGIIATGKSRGPLHEVTDVIEKPSAGDAPSNLASLGRYVLLPAVFEELGRTEPGTGNEIQLLDAVRRTLQHSRVVALEFEGDYYDLGTVAGYLKANVGLALMREGLREVLAPLLKELLQG